ncbi:hypothetical protein [Bdellovibrio sp.]|uniref:hypothetical protein n=1 Tax=Bdellovibrio sp. TaxID=28201 RepID=UPI0039E4168A
MKNTFIMAVTIVTLQSALIGCTTSNSHPQKNEPPAKKEEGIQFSCRPEQLPTIESELAAYFGSLGITPDLYTLKKSTAGTLVYTLNTPPTDTNTLDFSRRPEMNIKDEVIELPMKNKKTRKVSTVSRKEIVLALMQHGRLSEFSNEHCTASALIDHVGVRQSIVVWTEKLSWVWPDGGPAFWNKKYWKKGTPITQDPPHIIVNDMFMNQKKYAIGCYTASKVVIIQGVLDYYHRIKKDPETLRRIEARLMADGEPLVHIEPGKMWSFESDFKPQEMGHSGKLLTIQYGIAPRNIVPGDWIYLLNTDEKTKDKTGYEGSNAIYLGRNKLDDYYEDHNHSYQFDEKMDEVYQWRNGVFSRSRHFKKIKYLTPEQRENLYKTPAEGGLLMDFRTFPYFF